MSHSNNTFQKQTKPAQSMVEFALVAPLFVLIVFGIIELGIVFSVYVGLSNSAREAARAGVVYRYPGAMPTNSNTAQVAAIDTARQTSMTTALTTTLNPIVPSTAVTMTVAYLPLRNTSSLLAENPLRSGDTVSVTLQHRHTLFWGVFGQRDILITASSAARMEPGGGN
jgi:Flp pilus assembly protein TadG